MKCTQTVLTTSGFGTFRQCKKDATNAEYCTQHNPVRLAEIKKQKDEAFEKRMNDLAFRSV